MPLFCSILVCSRPSVSELHNCAMLVVIIICSFFNADSSNVHARLNGNSVEFVPVRHTVCVLLTLVCDYLSV